MVKVEELWVWPTKIKTYEWLDPEFDRTLVSVVMALREKQLAGPRIASDDEHRVYGIFKCDHPVIEMLCARVFEAVYDYLGKEAEGTFDGIELTGRAVVMGDRDHISTHVERREADLTIAYWPTGDAVGKPHSDFANPQFVVCDPSRHLTDLRLPHDDRHSIFIAPRPGLMIVMPNHIPHHQHPYSGNEPHVQIVCNVKIKFTESYLCNKW